MSVKSLDDNEKREEDFSDVMLSLEEIAVKNRKHREEKGENKVENVLDITASDHDTSSGEELIGASNGRMDYYDEQNTEITEKTKNQNASRKFRKLLFPNSKPKKGELDATSPLTNQDVWSRQTNGSPSPLSENNEGGHPKTKVFEIKPTSTEKSSKVDLKKENSGISLPKEEAEEDELKYHHTMAYIPLLILRMFRRPPSPVSYKENSPDEYVNVDLKHNENNNELLPDNNADDNGKQLHEIGSTPDKNTRRYKCNITLEFDGGTHHITRLQCTSEVIRI